MRNPTLLLVSLCLVATVATPTPARCEATDDALAEIATALKRIAELMEKQLQGGRLEVLLRRVETGQRRLDSVDEQLLRAQSSYEAQLQEASRIELQLASLADPSKAEALGTDAAMLGMQTENLEFELELTRRRIGDLGARISRLQAEKAHRQREVEDWQAAVDREISGTE